MRRIWVESEAGEGSTFHFLARFGMQAEPMQRRMFRADELTSTRVHVVDDNPSAGEIVSTMATSFGLEVDVALEKHCSATRYRVRAARRASLQCRATSGR